MDNAAQHRADGETGWQQLVLEMRGELARFMLARQCGSAQVDDLIHALFVTVDGDGSEPAGDTRAQMFRSADNLILDRRRGEWQGHDGEAIDREGRHQLDQALATLPERTARVLRMFRIEGRSQKAISDELKLSPSAVEKHLQRAWRALVRLRIERHGMAGNLAGGPALAPMLDHAIDWYLRLEGADADAWLEFTEWLEADTAHSGTYDWVVEDEAHWLSGQSHGMPSSDTAGSASVGELDEARNGPEVEQADRGSRKWAIWLGVALVASLCAVAGWWVLRPIAPNSAPYAVETGPGETRNVALGDGGTITLNGGTRIILDRENHRIAELVTGEALFSVARDNGGKFIVSVGEGTLVEMGTVFDVLLDDDRLRVAISEGLVRYQASARRVDLGPGDVLVVDRHGAMARYRQPVEAIGSWAGGRLVYDRAQLAEITADLERSLGVRITLAEDLAAHEFSGVIRTNADLESIRTSLEALLGASVEVDGLNWIVRP